MYEKLRLPDFNSDSDSDSDSDRPVLAGQGPSQ